jgi:riboflavin kinase/FMN adenylyltransferase
MNVFKTLEEITDKDRGALVVIGNFDGVHRGHQKLLAQAKQIAASMNKPLGILTFEPHPRHLFRPDDPPHRITPFDMKAERLSQSGVDMLYALEFDWDFASQSAEEFVQNILIDCLGAAHVVVGYDFCFGQLRKGSPETIKAGGLDVTIIDKITDENDELLSSSGIRQALRHGDIDAACAALGWDWEVRGEVVKGDQRGRELGYPTANVHLTETVHPAYGVYASMARIEGEDIWRPSATNIGIRPMFKIETAQVETFIFDFDREFYGKTLHVRPVKRLRSEAKFDSLDELIEQMAKDCAKARNILAA